MRARAGQEGEGEGRRRRRRSIRQVIKELVITVMMLTPAAETSQQLQSMSDRAGIADWICHFHSILIIIIIKKKLHKTQFDNPCEAPFKYKLLPTSVCCTWLLHLLSE
ncbi:unnamed protein product [Pleuronectes platessa]|uniref:Uncharacterized protein n=1 Tax=Pleuronectes platessa TaxID=8262 RepID=A0A9N7VFA4_PLEPL|nr:unnamed protein product [Pleuronectes platessa]